MTSWDSGSFGNPGEHNAPPLTVSPTPGGSDAKVIIAGIMSQNGSGAFGHTTSIGGGYTSMGVRTTGAVGVDTMVGAAYKAVAAGGSGGNLTMSWAANAGTEVWRALAIALATSATAPVQTGEQCETGSSVTLGVPPTVGNILVAVRCAVTGGFTAPNPPSGWTLVDSVVITSSAPGGLTLDIIVRCVLEGEDAVIDLGDASFTHWQFLSEWAIT